MMSAKEQMEKYRKNHPDFVVRQTEKSRLRMQEKRKDPVKRALFVKGVREWRARLREEIFNHYSNGKQKCLICGFSDKRALCLDHIANDGAEHRRSVSAKWHRGGNAVAIYLDLKKRNFPPGFQILCCNCNRIKEVERVNGKICVGANEHDGRRAVP